MPPRLPPLREELTLHPGPVGHDGAPSWTLHDPVRNQFFRLDWPVFAVLSHWTLGTPQAVAAAVAAETPLEIGPADVEDIAGFLTQNQLLQSPGKERTRFLLALREAHRESWLHWLLHHYLFFRIPLLHPDRLLSAVAPRLAWLGGRGFRLASLGALLAGLVLAGRQWDSFTATLVDRLSLTGLASFGIALALAKTLHEASHAVTAKTLGCRVPTMGIAFLVMWPVLYTDVNEAWKLPGRRQRLLVGGAGILAELTLAAWATLAWGLLPAGPARAMAFTLAASSWVSSLLLNMSPFMRFDGYFLLMDGLDMPNLHGRAFDLGRWWLREKLFGLDEPPPEAFPPRRHAFLIAFAFAAWLYRLVLFLGIAALVYHFFIKVLGVLMFTVEIGWFVLRPLALELGEWRRRGGAIRRSRRAWASGALLAGLVLLAVTPWSGTVRAPALLKAADHAAIHTPVPAVLTALRVRDGQAVKAGEVLAELAAPDLEHSLAQTKRHIETERYQLASVDFEQSFRDRAPVIARQLQTDETAAAALAAQRERLVLTAPFDGVVTDLAPDMAAGEWIGPAEPLLALRGAGTAVVEAYAAEEDLPRLRVGAAARFLPEGRLWPLEARVEAIDRSAQRSLSDPALASPFGGPLPARQTSRALVPDGAVYRLRLAVAAPPRAVPLPVPVSLRGQAIIDGERESLVARLWRGAAAVVLREGGM